MPNMIAQPELLRAIQLVKAGEREPAAALLAQLVDDTELDKHSRAVSCLWLAETSDDRHFKINCLRRALAYERHNTQVQQVLDQLLAEVSDRPGQDSSQTTGTAIRLAQPPLVGGHQRRQQWSGQRDLPRYAGHGGDNQLCGRWRAKRNSRD